MTALSADLTARVAKLLPRLASDHQGEVAATAAALTRALRSGGCDFHDLAAHVAEGPREIVVFRDRPAQAGPRPFDGSGWRGASRAHPNAAHRERVTRCQATPRALSDWETSFLASIAQRLRVGRPLTEAQAASLDGIATRLGVA